MKYRVIRNCYGFKGRYWEKDQIVEVDNTEIPPEHFEKIQQLEPIENSSVDIQAENSPIIEKKQKHKKSFK